MSDSRDVIRERILSNINEKYDKMPGSLVWEFSQGIGIEIEDKYIEIEDALNQKFAGTADFENLKVIAYEKGVDWKPATFASGIVKINGFNGTKINIGDAVASDLNEYVVVEENIIGIDGIALVKVECKEQGPQGNTPIGTITKFPKTLLGIHTVINEEEFKNGYNEETRESLLQRYYNYIRKPATSGNIYHYQQWAESVEGVGAVKVKPLWNGAGTVKVLILDRNKAIASQELIKKVADYIEEERPVGPQVTVTSAEMLQINISCKITLSAGYTLQQVQQLATINVNNYFKDIIFIDDYVYYAKLGNIIFNTNGVSDIDYSNFKINNGISNILLLDNNLKSQIPLLNSLVIT